MKQKAAVPNHGSSLFSNDHWQDHIRGRTYGAGRVDARLDEEQDTQRHSKVWRLHLIPNSEQHGSQTASSMDPKQRAAWIPNSEQRGSTSHGTAHGWYEGRYMWDCNAWDRHILQPTFMASMNMNRKTSNERVAERITVTWSLLLLTWPEREVTGRCEGAVVRGGGKGRW